MYFIFFKSVPKLCSLSDDQVETRHNQNYLVSGLNLKHFNLNDTIQAEYHKK